jgi:sugar phosphate isomerase/epimerase
MQPLQIGVCTWSLKMPDLDQWFSTIREKLGLRLIQIGFWGEEFRDRDRIQNLLSRYELEVSATCIGFAEEDYSSIQKIAETGGFKPDAYWEARLAKTIDYADFTRELGVKLLAAHIGFVPHDKADPQYKVMVDRIKRICDELGQRGITLVMETGQEKAEDLLEFMAAVNRDNIGVNFDPANMVLYGVGEPVDAVSLLRERIVHVHMKDANWSDTPMETWGEEVVLGSGEADIPRVVSKLRSGGYRGPLVIEREAGDNRVGDIQEAIRFLEDMLG